MSWKQKASEAIQKASTWLITNPRGEEVLEGTLGGLVAGGTLLGTDQSGERTALQTAAAVGGGIGLGMAGRRIGWGLGNKIAGDPLANQQGLLASFGRMMGSESTVEGLGEQGKMAAQAMRDSLRQTQNYNLSLEAMDAISNQHKRSEFINKYSFQPEDVETYITVSDEVGRMAVNNMNKNFGEMAKVFNKAKVDPTLEAGQSEMLGELSGYMEGLAKEDATQEITGAHVGKALGRFIGDELGVIGGVTAGGVVANQLGFKTDKDRRIDKLQELLSQHGIKY